MFRFLKSAAAILTALSFQSLHAEPRIDEIMAAGQSVIKDEDNATPDWLEVHNPDATPVELGGWYLSDNAARPRKWAFPALTVPPGGHLIVFASGKNRRPATGNLHTGFGLDGAGGVLLLSRPDGTLAQTFSYPAQLPDVAWDGVNFLSVPTPGAANDPTLEPITLAPEFSQPRGFQNAPFLLTLSSGTPDAAIYYTLDGTEPGTSSPRYAAPLKIAKTTVIRAVAISAGNDASPLVARTYLFPADIVKQSPRGAAPKGWPAKWGQNHVDYGMDPDITGKAPYKSTIKDDLRAVPSFSVIMDLDDLFDASTGIYANPFDKGREWERPMSLEYIEPAGGGGFQSGGGIRIRGGASRDTGNAKHSLQFRFRKEYGAAHLDFPLFGESGPARTDAFDLRWDHLVSWHYSNEPGANQLQDIFGRDSQLAASGVAKQGNLCNLYLNGQYWGLFFIDERVNGDFGANHFGGAPEDYDVIRYDQELGSSGLNEGTRRVWRAAFDLGFAGFADNARYFRALGRNPDGSRNPAFERLIDEENLIDYMLVGIWCGATDNPVVGGTDNNWTSIRSRKGDFGFRFFVHDFELSMFDVDGDFIGPTPTENPLADRTPEQINPWHFWMAMRMNAEFRMKVADRVQRHFFNNGPLTAEACIARWNARMQEMDRAIVAESARWGDGVSGGGGWGPLGDARKPIINPPPRPGPGGGGGENPGHRAYTRLDWIEGATMKRDNYVALRSGKMLEHLKSGDLYPATPAPVITPAGGSLPAGGTVDAANPNGTGVILYTLNGPDPRLVGGGVSPEALTWIAPIAPARKTTVRARVKDGNAWSALVELEFLPGVDFGALKLTEIHYNPAVEGAETSDDGEFIEIKNTGPAALDLSGCTFTTGISFTFPAGTAIAPGGFFVLARNAAVFEQKHPGRSPDGIFTGKLGDDGESIVLTTFGGSRVFAIEYDDEDPWPLAPDGFGASLVYDGNGDPDDGRNWRASRVKGGSPGADEPAPVFAPKVVLNEVLGLPAGSAFIELHNPTAAAADISGWRLGSGRALAGAKVFDAGTIIPAGGFLVVDAAAGMPALEPAGGSVFLLSQSGAYAHECPYAPLEEGVATARHVNADGGVRFTAKDPTPSALNGSPLERGPLRIAEIHYAGAADFVEIQNAGDTTVALDGLRLVGMNFIFPPATALQAGERLVVTSVTPAEFAAAFPENSPTLLASAPGDLQDNGERVALEETFGGGWRVLDEVRYNDRHPWPADAAVLADSLHRLPVAYGDESTSWTAGKPTPGTKGADGRPVVELTSPGDRLVTTAGALLTLRASAGDVDGNIGKVEFFVDGEPVGEDTDAPYEGAWPAAPGTHDLIARAYDEPGNFADSAPVVVFVRGNEARDGGEGLMAEYFPNPNLQNAAITTTVPDINFDWFETSPGEGIPRSGFSARFTGKLLPRSGGNHSLQFRHAGGLRVSVNGSLVIDAWQEPVISDREFAAYASAEVDLNAHEPVDLIVEYFDTNSHGYLSMSWYEPGDFQGGIVPQSQLYTPQQNVGDFGISTPSRIAHRRIGQRIRVSLDSTRGTAPVTWTIVEGTLPAGVTLNPAGSLSGAATEGGDFSFRLQAEDATGAIKSRLFSMRIVAPADRREGPFVRILNPLDGSVVMTSPVIVDGTVRGSAEIVDLSYSIAGGERHPLPPTANWRVALDRVRGLGAGKNFVRVFAVDSRGREAVSGELDFRYRYRSSLNVSVSGAGTVSAGFLGTTRRYVGEDFEIAATPAPGWLFSNWQPDFRTEPRAKFTMVDDMSLTAVFVQNPFGPYAGRYVGIVGEGSRAMRYQLNIGRRGGMTLSLWSGAKRLSISGIIMPDGRFGLYRGDEPGLPNYVEVAIRFDTREVVLSTQYFLGDFFQFYESFAKRSAWKGDCPAAGTWTLTVASPAPEFPGSGFAAMTINANGRAILNGRNSDGSLLTGGFLMADDFSLPLSSALDDGGLLFGTLSYSSQRGARIGGDLQWVAATLDATVPADGAPFIEYAPGFPAISVPLGTAYFTDVNPDHSVTLPVILNDVNQFVFSGAATPLPVLAVDPRTGLIAGHYVHPGTGTRTQIRGVVNQSTNTAAGVILARPRGGFSVGPSR